MIMINMNNSNMENNQKEKNGETENADRLLNPEEEIELHKNTDREELKESLYHTFKAQGYSEEEAKRIAKKRAEDLTKNQDLYPYL